MSNVKTKNIAQGNRLFMLGQVAATPGALDLVERTETNVIDLLHRHQHGDWGSVPAEDAEENARSIEDGCRILSSYFLNADERVWIITEADRSMTTLLLPDEY